MMIGEVDSNPKDSRGPRVILDTSGRPRKEDTYVILPSLAEEVLPDQTRVPDNMVTRYHIEMEVESESYREAKALEVAQAIERDRQKSLKVI